MPYADAKYPHDRRLAAAATELLSVARLALHFAIDAIHQQSKDRDCDNEAACRFLIDAADNAIAKAEGIGE